LYERATLHLHQALLQRIDNRASFFIGKMGFEPGGVVFTADLGDGLGRLGMTWEEEDWVDEDATSHRGPDD